MLPSVLPVVVFGVFPGAQHNRWLEHPNQRQMSGECWKKGSLTFHK